MHIDPMITKLNSKVAAVVSLPTTEEPSVSKISASEIIDLVFIYEVNKDKEMTIIRSSGIREDFAKYCFLVGDLKLMKSN